MSLFLFFAPKKPILVMLLKVNKTQEIKNSVDFIKFFIKHLILFLRMYVSMQMSTIYITLND